MREPQTLPAVRPSAPLVGFNGASEQPLGEPGIASAMVTAEAEIKAALVSAAQNPRDEYAACDRIMKSCQRPNLAREAVYSFRRAGNLVEGPSAPFARELARCWGSIRRGIRIIAFDGEWMHIMGWAWDVETNNFVAEEDRFRALIQRKGQGWVKPDERDLRELKNRRGAICVRNAILQLLPPDVVEDAVTKAKETTRLEAAGDLGQDREKTIRHLVTAFGQMGVTNDLLEGYLGHKLNQIDDAELAQLRSVYKGIANGDSTREQHFDIGARPATQPGESKTQSLAKQLAAPVAERKAGAFSPGEQPPLQPHREPKRQSTPAASKGDAVANQGRVSGLRAKVRSLCIEIGDSAFDILGSVGIEGRDELNGLGDEVLLKQAVDALTAHKEQMAPA